MLNGQQKPSHEMSLLEVFLGQLERERAAAAGHRDYTVSRTATAPGLYSYAVLFWTRECITFGALGPTGGQVNVESYGGPQSPARTPRSRSTCASPRSTCRATSTRSTAPLTPRAGHRLSAVAPRARPGTRGGVSHAVCWKS